MSGRPLLAAPLEPCFFRAATDNDRGGSQGSSYAARWVAAGLDRLQPDGEHRGRSHGLGGRHVSGLRSLSLRARMDRQV
jgi:hypothetical protein